MSKSHYDVSTVAARLRARRNFFVDLGKNGHFEIGYRSGIFIVTVEDRSECSISQISVDDARNLMAWLKTTFGELDH
jgi:hypothetical protein